MVTHTATKVIHGPTSAEQTVLEISNISKSYGGARVVDEVSISVKKGEIFGILGSNGAGKTTTVECAQGIRRADNGSIRVLGQDPLAARKELRGRVGSQLQDSNLPERLRVSEAMRLFANDRSQADAGMETWELTGIAGTPFGALSGGQRQRLFLALALLNSPEIVFLDELTQGLDPNARRSVWELIERVRDRGTTVVLVTHFMEEAEVLCDRVAVMAGGRVVARGTPADLIDEYGSGVRMRFAGPADLVPELLQYPEVLSAEVVGSEIEVIGPSTAIAWVGSALVGRASPPPPIRVDQPNLEQALLRLMSTTGESS